MEKNWKVSHLELLEGGTHFGFVLYDQKGRPCVSFGYADDKKAFAGRDLVAAALREVEQVLGRWATDAVELPKEKRPRLVRVTGGGAGYALANAGHDTRALQDWLGHRSIQHTVRYTELSPTRFKDFWRE